MQTQVYTRAQTSVCARAHKEDLKGLSSLACEGKELPYDSDAEHPPLDEAVCRETRECGEQPATEVRQGGQEAVLEKETQTYFFRRLLPWGSLFNTRFDK